MNIIGPIYEVRRVFRVWGCGDSTEAELEIETSHPMISNDESFTEEPNPEEPPDLPRVQSS